MLCVDSKIKIEKRFSSQIVITSSNCDLNDLKYAVSVFEQECYKDNFESLTLISYLGGKRQIFISKKLQEWEE